jgi:ectoine hydroxylase-related dioxygenase (phytanoyl-CoA dioxygenase family)
MKKGSLAIWLGDIFHGAGANTCQPGDKDAVRLIYGLFAVVRLL